MRPACFYESQTWSTQALRIFKLVGRSESSYVIAHATRFTFQFNIEASIVPYTISGGFLIIYPPKILF